MPALGDRFRAAREARGLTLSDVSEQLRIRALYLGAIEEENWSQIGAAVYARGFLRTYARFLGLDAEEAVAAFNLATGTGPVSAGAPDPDELAPAPNRRLMGPMIWIASIVAVALIAFVVYNAMTLSRPETVAVVPSASPTDLASSLPSATASGSPLPSYSPGASALPGASGSPLPSPTPTVAPPGTPNVLELHLTAPSWLRVSVDGGASIEGTFPAGTIKAFHGKVAFVRVGNAGGVEAFVDGTSVGILGKAGDVVERTFTL